MTLRDQIQPAWLKFKGTAHFGNWEEAMFAEGYKAALDLIANPDDEMVERCAKAIMEAGGDNPERLCAWPDNDPAWKAAIPEVRAVLKAIGYGDA